MTNGEETLVRRLSERLVRCAEGLQHAVGLLGRKRADREILQRCAELRHLTREAGDVYREAVASLYGADSRAAQAAQVLELLKWHELLTKLDEAVGGCGRVALELETIVEAHA